MTPHLTEEELIQHFYGDGRTDLEPDVDAHLRSCSTCSAAWSELRETLKLVDDGAVPEPGPEFERVMWAKVQQALPARHEQGGLLAFFETHRAASWLFTAAGLAAVLAVGIVVSGRLSPARRPAASEPASPTVTLTSARDTARLRERVLLTALDNHFQQSEMLLVEVMNAPPGGDENFGAERQTADDLLESSRLYRTTAQLNGDVQFAQLLEDLESVLVEIARSPEKVDRKDFNSLRARIDDDNLLFKVRAVSQQVQDRQRSLTE
jgi:hypothetical protein